MDWLQDLKKITVSDVQIFLDQYAEYGPITGILAPMSESFFPFLPLFALVVGNAAANGFLLGFIYSWIGVSIGSCIVFNLVRKYGTKFSHFLHKKPRSKAFFHWIESKGFTTIFIFSAIPFTSSLLINVVSGLSTISFRTFMLATVLGKGVMVLVVSYIGYDILTIYKDPGKIAISILFIFTLWLIGKRLEARTQS